jgi:DNA-binding transcriptional LysR family regulator
MDVDTRLLRSFAEVAAVRVPARADQADQAAGEPAERQGHPVRIGAVTDQPDAYLTAIANGDGIALVPESASRYYARPGITYRPVTGVSPSQVGVAWPPANDANPVVQDFVRSCLDHKPAA